MQLFNKHQSHFSISVGVFDRIEIVRPLGFSSQKSCLSVTYVVNSFAQRDRGGLMRPGIKIIMMTAITNAGCKQSQHRAASITLFPQDPVPFRPKQSLSPPHDNVAREKIRSKRPCVNAFSNI